MSSIFPKAVEVTEVAARDGLQLEKALIPTERKIALIKAFATAGASRIEATSFVSPRAVPQLADAADVVAGIRGLGPVVAALAPNEKGARRAAEAGVDEIVTFVSASESHSRANLNKTIAQAIADVEGVANVARETGKTFRSAIAVAFGCPFEGDVSPKTVSAIASSLKAFGIRSLTLGDTTGMASPRHVEALCGRLIEDHPDIALTLHFHDTRGLALVNVLAGLRLGITRYESAAGGVGGCPFAPGATGNVCTEDLIYMLSELGVETGFDLDKAIEAGLAVEQAVGRKLPGRLMRAGPRTRLHELDAVRRAIG
jgi:hydroxymethylglutaryl-CoA lyase